MSGDAFICHNLGKGCGMWWIEARDAAIIRQCTGQFPIPTNYLAPKVSSTEVEK